MGTPALSLGNPSHGFTCRERFRPELCSTVISFKKSHNQIQASVSFLKDQSLLTVFSLMHKSFSLPSLRIYTILSLREKRKVKVVVMGEPQSSPLAQTTEVAVQSVHPRKTSNTAVFPQAS